MSDNPGIVRAKLGIDGSGIQDARDAVSRFVAELQAGWDQHDADISNQHFADDVMWGSPFGASVHGYEQLHSIHVRLKKAQRGGARSRFEIERVLVPYPDVALALVRRVALDSNGRPLNPAPDFRGAFSELALYVLVRRGETWWLAAGQNTPVRPTPD